MGLFDKFKKNKDKKQEKQVLQNSQEEIKQQSGNEKSEENNGGFLSFVLLSETRWDKKKFVQDIKREWKFEIMDEEERKGDEKGEEVLFLKKNGTMIVASYMPTPVPNGEAEYYAGSNYLWKDGVNIVKGHKAHMIIAVLGSADSPNEKGRLLTQATTSMLNQRNAIAVYSDGAVYEPQFYRDVAQLMREGDMEAVPIYNLVWFGICSPNANQAGMYTYGMRKFGKDEMEVYVPSNQFNPNKLREFLSSIVGYVIEENVILHDGETIGFSAEQKLAITKSKGVAVDGETLKIAYE